MTSLKLHSNDGHCLFVDKNHWLLKNTVFSYINPEEPLPFNKEDLSLLFYQHFEELNYDYEKMINHAKEIVCFSYIFHEEMWKSYIKLLLRKYEELKYYYYHINVFFKLNECADIIENYPTIDSLIEYIKNKEYNESELENIYIDCYTKLIVCEDFRRKYYYLYIDLLSNDKILCDLIKKGAPISFLDLKYGTYNNVFMHGIIIYERIINILNEKSLIFIFDYYKSDFLKEIDFDKHDFDVEIQCSESIYSYYIIKDEEFINYIKKSKKSKKSNFNYYKNNYLYYNKSYLPKSDPNWIHFISIYFKHYIDKFKFKKLNTIIYYYAIYKILLYALDCDNKLEKKYYIENIILFSINKYSFNYDIIQSLYLLLEYPLDNNYLMKNEYGDFESKWEQIKKLYLSSTMEKYNKFQNMYEIVKYTSLLKRNKEDPYFEASDFEKNLHTISSVFGFSDEPLNEFFEQVYNNKIKIYNFLQKMKNDRENNQYNPFIDYF